MYPAGELDELALRKRLLRSSIARNRWEMREAAVELVRPLEWVDRVIAKWRQISPFMKIAAVPLGFMLKKSIFPRIGIFSSLIKFAPMAFSMFRSFRAHKA
ncbi:MAG: hypothetical protein JWM32_2223 [Verrucomicrobia bacterium]|nr:hypothetical protein [Verrucomicrobiota bacterium]